MMYTRFQSKGLGDSDASIDYIIANPEIYGLPTGFYSPAPAPAPAPRAAVTAPVAAPVYAPPPPAPAPAPAPPPAAIVYAPPPAPAPAPQPDPRTVMAEALPYPTPSMIRDAEIAREAARQAALKAGATPEQAERVADQAEGDASAGWIKRNPSGSQSPNAGGSGGGVGILALLALAASMLGG